MTDNPCKSPQPDLTPPELTPQLRAKEVQLDGEGNSQFSILTLLLLTTCAAVNAAAFAQILGVLPYVALIANALAFAELVRDMEKRQSELRMTAYCLLAMVILTASMLLVFMILVALPLGTPSQ